jgi:AraC-like DNA-binding protein
MEKRKVGRPSKKGNVDLDQLRQCAQKQWNDKEIAAHFKISVDTLERHFAEEIAAARQTGRAKLRDLQWKRALEGSDTMIKHMSEHYLDQHNKTKISLEEAWDQLPIEKKAALIKKDLDGSDQ